MMHPQDSNPAARREPAFACRFVDGEFDHGDRPRAILRNHPEVRELFGPSPWSGALLAVIIVVQLGVQVLVAGLPLGVQVLAAYLFGAFVSHALWVLAHECTHDLIFKNRIWNRWASILANLPLVVPATVAYSVYHLKHHSHFSQYRHDSDVPSWWEAWLLRGGFLRRLIWAAVLPVVFLSVRSLRIGPEGKAASWRRFLVANVVIQIAFVAAWATTWYLLLGKLAVWYLLCSSYFSVALHPLVARWITEHYVFRDGQETYSYYGILNRVALNVGYHTEHHDFPCVPWSRLPALRRLAPEMYGSLFAHYSWTKLFIRFLFDRRLEVYRIARHE